MLNTLFQCTKANNMQLKYLTVSDLAKPILDRYEFNRHPTRIVQLFDEYLEYIK